MTIKQQGGVFGRHPEFGTVDVNGLTTTKSLTIQSDEPILKISDEFSGSVYSNEIFQSGFSCFYDQMGLGNHSFRIGRNPALTVRFDRDVVVDAGNLVIGTSGKGIDFSATSGTGTSELFDDYEEGSFSPTIVGSTTAGSTTYSTQSATYTKVGNMVMFRMNLTWSGHTGTGFMRVNGLPFSIAGNNTPFSSRFSGIVFGNVPNASGISGGTTIRLYNMAETSGATGEISMDAAGDLYIAGVYHT